MNKENSGIENINNWINNSVILKLAIITILMLLLLIPLSLIHSIIQEREKLHDEAINEVSAKWANRQLINGPILTIPWIYEYESEEKLLNTVRHWHILPQNLKIKGEITPEKLRRGIYEVVVYESGLSISGHFDMNQPPDMKNLKEILYEQAFLTFGISDLRGIKNPIHFKWDSHQLEVIPGSRIPDLIDSGVTIDVPGIGQNTDKIVNFTFQLHLQGSHNLSFIPVGSTTDVQLTSGWNSPSFNGNFLPDSREITDEGFRANWSILQLNRNFPQSWIETDQSEQMKASEFGVDLILPLDDYQKSMRSVKYGVMTVALTFLIFFLVEILNKRKIHPFQYALVGLALCLFYILLVSISEHSHFYFAFVISTIGIISMVSLYSLSIFRVKKFTVILASALIGIYSFLFITLQLTNYALLIGSIGLTLILAATMYLTRKVNWYRLNIGGED